MSELRIEGFVIVSADGRLANAHNVMPDELKIEGDKEFFTAALERADLVVHGRHSQEEQPNAPKRRRLILTGKVAAIARAVTDGLEQGGVLPVLKHIPGHGRATADSHFRLPTVDTARDELERTDFAAFQPLADLPMAMTAHVVFSALDPVHPATTSATIIEQVIRGLIGFQGLLMSDDVSMNALAGSIAERTRAIVSAGCDMILHCNGNLDEMREVARETPELTGKALERAKAALAVRKQPEPLDRQAARAELDALLDRVGTA